MKPPTLGARASATVPCIASLRSLPHPLASPYLLSTSFRARRLLTASSARESSASTCRRPSIPHLTTKVLSPPRKPLRQVNRLPSPCPQQVQRSWMDSVRRDVGSPDATDESSFESVCNLASPSGADDSERRSEEQVAEQTIEARAKPRSPDRPRDAGRGTLARRAPPSQGTRAFRPRDLPIGDAAVTGTAKAAKPRCFSTPYTSGRATCGGQKQYLSCSGMRVGGSPR